MGDFDLPRPGDHVLAPEDGDGFGGQSRRFFCGGDTHGVEPAQVGRQIGEQDGHALAVADFERGLGGRPLLFETGFGPLGGTSPERLQGPAQIAIGPFGGRGIRRSAGWRRGVDQFDEGRRGDRRAGPGGPGFSRPNGARGQGPQQAAIRFAEAVVGAFEIRRGPQENTTVRFL